MIKDMDKNEYEQQKSKARKTWVSVVDKSIFDNFSREQKFAKYKEIDYKVLQRYWVLVKGRKDKELHKKDYDQIMLEASNDVLKSYN